MAIRPLTSDQIRQLLDKMPTLDYARKCIEGSFNMSKTEHGNNEIYACVSMFVNHATQMGGIELENYVRNQIASELIKQLIGNKNLVITQKGNMYNDSIDFSARVFIFSAEELKKHDQDVIEDFASRSE